MSNEPILGFFAYPSTPSSSGDSIRAAVKELNQGSLVKLKTWEECKIGGKFVIDTICTEIENADIFCADVTGINPNVLFELGYAIALDKRIWLAIDPSYSDKKDMFDRLRFLTTVGYSEFRNSRDIVDAFYHDQPFEDPRSSLYSLSIAPSLEMGIPGRLLYLKSLVDSEASVQLTGRIADSCIPQTVDDPVEVTVQTLTWYGVKTFSSIGVVCHLLSSERQGFLLNNARNAFVAGLAFGMGKPLLMLAEGDLLGPLDYRDTAQQYTNAAKAVEQLNAWIEPLEADWRGDEKSREDFKATVKHATELKTFQLGEPVAENESEGLVDHYFIETSAFRDAVEGKH